MIPSASTLGPLLLALGCAGIELAPHPTNAARLRHRPADLPSDLLARLRIHRAAVLALLVNGYTPTNETDSEYVLGERLGIAEELRLATHIGSPAWLIAIGESLHCSCDQATIAVHCTDGQAYGSDSTGDQGQRRNAVCDCEGCGCRSEPALAAPERRERNDGGHD